MIPKGNTAWQAMVKAGIVKTGHFVGASGLHLDTYLDKDSLNLNTLLTTSLCTLLCADVDNLDFDVVVAPAIGAIVPGFEVARQINMKLRFEDPVAFVIAEKQGDGFRIRRSQQAQVAGRKVLIVEDILTTGSSARKVVDAVWQADAFRIVGLAAYVNRGRVRGEDLGVPKVVALTCPELKAYQKAECPMCQAGIPISDVYGHGASR